MKIALVAPCYKRPRVAQRLLDGVARHHLPVDIAVIWLQPLTFPRPVSSSELPFTVDWHRAQQQPPNLSRDAATRYVIETYAPDIVWLTDDDIVINEHTQITDDMLALLSAPTTGIVGITRQMVRSPKKTDEPVIEPLPYIGGGWLFRPDVFLSAGGFPNDACDEKAWGLAVYLAGHTNYRTRQSYVIHEQGGKTSPQRGGILAQFEDGQKDASIRFPPTTEFGPNHVYLQLNPDPVRRAGIDYGFRGGSKHYKLTPAAKAEHDRNAQGLGA